MKCSVCGVQPAIRRQACWGCYSKFRRAGLLGALAPRSDGGTRFAPSSPIVEALRLLADRLTPAARAVLHDATRPRKDAPPALGRVKRHG